MFKMVFAYFFFCLVISWSRLFFGFKLQKYTEKNHFTTVKWNKQPYRRHTLLPIKSNTIDICGSSLNCSSLTYLTAISVPISVVLCRSITSWLLRCLKSPTLGPYRSLYFSMMLWSVFSFLSVFFTRTTLSFSW